MSANLAEKFNSYAALSEMGIVRFHEIANYSLRQDGADKDVLRVIYKRAKGFSVATQPQVQIRPFNENCHR